MHLEPLAPNRKQVRWTGRYALVYFSRDEVRCLVEGSRRMRQ